MKYTVVTAYTDGYCKSEGAESYSAALNAIAIYSDSIDWWHSYIFNQNGDMVAKIESDAP